MNLTLVALILAMLVPAGSIHAELVVHEWGTFTSLVGSNGLSQAGMYHEDEALPHFVHDFGETSAKSPRLLCRQGKGCMPASFLEMNSVTLKMETPVIYFYTDAPRALAVNVRFPEGVISQTFPAPVETFPTRFSAPILANGNTTFKVDILPSTTGNVPFVEPGNIYEHARKVQSSLVVSGNEQEKFIFYRGLGRFQPRISIASAQGEISLKLRRAADKPLAAFVIHVDQGGQGRMLDAEPFLDKVINSELIEQLSDHGEFTKNPAILTMPQARLKLIDSLRNAGLFDDEACAMINTWESGYFKVPGLRLLYILPANEVDEILPLTISPAPDSVKRVFVARIEILLDTEEAKILNEVLIKRENFSMSTLGRFAEPILRRVAELYTGTEMGIKNLLAKLIQQAMLE